MVKRRQAKKPVKPGRGNKEVTLREHNPLVKRVRALEAKDKTMHQQLDQLNEQMASVAWATRNIDPATGAFKTEKGDVP